MPDRLTALLDGALAGSIRDLARLITTIDNDMEDSLALLDRVAGRGNTPVLGITGPPGSGKSTLVDRLTAMFRSRGERVGVLAVDPSSPLTGGAVLGDRIRMQQHTTDPGVFIRSLGSRGHHGGLTRSTDRVLELMRCCGFDQLIVETVGVGQTELQVMELADTVAVVLVPEAGDTVQAMKAGLMEIAHLFVINKADRPGAERLAADLTGALRHGSAAAASPASGRPQADIPVLSVSALQGLGLDLLFGAILDLRGAGKRTRRVVNPGQQLVALLEDALAQRLRRRALDPAGPLADQLVLLSSGRRSPYDTARDVLADPQLVAALLERPEGSRR